MKRIARFGECLFAALMIYSGVMHFKFATYVAAAVPSWLPWHLFWAYGTGVALFAAGVSILVHRFTRVAAPLLAVLLCSFVLFIHLPSMAHSVTHAPQEMRVLWSFNGTGGINNALKDLALTLSAFILALSGSSLQRNRQWVLAALINMFAIVMLLFGAEHFYFTQYTPGIPSWSFVNFWIPWNEVWGYLTGAGLFIGGSMILLRKRMDLAAASMGLMILFVAALTYAFRMAAHLGSYGELTNTMKDVAVAGGAMMLAGFAHPENQPAKDTPTVKPSAIETV
jgi:uncharacterized membrane protein